MNETDGPNSRREVLTGSTAADALSLASVAGRSAKAHEINAVHPTEEQIEGFLAVDHDGPIVMVNLLKFKPDGGRAHYAKYAAGIMPILERIGARVLFAGQAAFPLLGDVKWDAVALVQYPTKEIPIEMLRSPEYAAIRPHREAGLEGQVLYAVIQTGPA